MDNNDKNICLFSDCKLNLVFRLNTVPKISYYFPSFMPVKESSKTKEIFMFKSNKHLRYNLCS